MFLRRNSWRRFCCALDFACGDLYFVCENEWCGTNIYRGLITLDKMKTADEMIASVDATLANWRAAFESSPSKSKRARGAATDDEASTPKSPRSTSADPEAYQQRLSTFQPATYFAKPLALSPLVCAAFG